MAVSDQTRSGDLAETFKSERETTKNQIRVALPGIIQSFDPDAVTAVVQPAIRSVEKDNDGNRITKNYPLLVDVPVVFPRGGGCTLTFPVKAGDECLVIFADRCIDFWWQSGGIQESVDDRMHDLSDAFCIARSGDLAETFKSERETTKNQIRVALPGIIQSFDPDAVTAVVQPAIRYVEIDNDGNRITKNYPLLVDVPVVFPRGGGCTLTFPVKAGDECLVVFADRCIDFWWQSGGIQESVDDRMHDLSDAFCIVGPQSQARKISGINTSATQLRSDDGSTYFELNPDTRKIKIVAPGGLDVVAPLADFSEKVTIHGLLTWMGGMVGSVVSGVASKITGAVEFLGSVKANGKPIDDTHTHGGVQRGGSNTDGVN